jgi:very-short-patch-repair endonuclease
MRICEFCNKQFVYTGPKGKNYPAKTCSVECYTANRSKRLSKLNVDRRIYEKIEKQCENCGKIITTVNAESQKVTCSKKCHAERLSRLYSGRKITEEWKQRQNESKTREKIVKYGSFVCEKCRKTFETNTSLRSHRSYCTPGNEGILCCELCQKEFSPRGYKIHMKSHDKEWRNKTTAALRKSLLTRTSCQTTSKAELAFFEKLKILFADVIHKFRIEVIAHEYDFFIPSKKLIIEFDGDYWHGNKKLHELSSRMKKQFCIDRAWSEKAVEAGYRIIRVWASESKDFKLENYYVDTLEN